MERDGARRRRACGSTSAADARRRASARSKRRSKTVAAYLGNTPAVRAPSYVDPRVIDRYPDGYDDRSCDRRAPGPRLRTWQRPRIRARVESAVLALLKDAA